MVQLVGKEFTEGREVFGSDLAGDCSSVSNATQRARCERFLQVRRDGEGSLREWVLTWVIVFTLSGVCL